MKTIKQMVDINPAYYSDKLYGLEIEVEGENLPTSVSSFWRVERDDSLKTEEAWEYVTKKPHHLLDMSVRLDELQRAYNNCNSVVYDSVRAGVHVHMNVQDWNIKQLLTFAICYYGLEDVLMKWCGENREGNLFTLRTKDAEFVLFKLVETLQQRNLNVLNTDVIRYASLNFLSLFKYGTVEFRGMRGTSDLGEIYRWMCIIDELRTNSLTYDSPVDVVNGMSGDGEEGFIRRLLPNHYQILIKNNPSYARDIRLAIRRIQMIAYGINWDSLSQPRVNIFKNGGSSFA
jgi:hypothetical protein